MKRSEMVKLIAEKLYIYTVCGEQLASETLAWLEAQGMQPPFYEKPVYNGEFFTFEHEWEPEVTETEPDNLSDEEGTSNHGSTGGMKRTEMIEHIAEELLNIVNAHAHSWQDEEKFCSRKASDLLDMIEGFGMRPPEREDLVEIKPDDENVYKTSYGSPAIDLDYGPIYRKVKISGWESEE